MAKFSNIAIVSDMDGTFLGNDSRLVQENMEAIRYFNANGGKFTVITGRNYTTALDPYPALREIISAPIGLHNGACIYDIHSESIVSEFAIDTQLAIEIFNYLRSLYPKMSTSMRCLKTFHFMPPDHESAWYRPFRSSVKFFDSADEIKNLSVHKINMQSEDEAFLTSVRKEIEHRFSDKVGCTTAEPEIVEIMRKGVSKAGVIPQLRKLCGLQNAKFFAIGDYENDLEMLKSADYAACPENALDCVKSISSIHVCHHDKGAVAHLIKIIEENYLG